MKKSDCLVSIALSQLCMQHSGMEFVAYVVHITSYLVDGYWDCRPAWPDEGHSVGLDTCPL